MTEPQQQGRELEAKVAGQVEVVAATLRDRGISVATAVDDEGGVDFMYQEGVLLVRDRDLERVVALVRRPEDDRSLDEWRPDLQRVTRGVVTLPLAPTRFAGDGVLAALREIDDEFGIGVATPNHVLTVAPVGPCPATEPEEVVDGIEPWPGVCLDNDGDGVFIYIADTGLVAGAADSHPWLAGVDGDDDPVDPANLGQYTAHGTFVAGVARCMAPRANIYVADVFGGGSSLETDAVTRLSEALGSGVDIFHLSVAAPTRYELPLLSFDAWREQLREYKGVVCVVAAGNNSSSRPFWPGAYPEMVSVGALGLDWRNRASFTNYGAWVDVYTPGRGLINAYTTGHYQCRDKPYTGQQRDFYGMTRWSGTSFSSPMMSGLIAAWMSRTGENGQEAAAALLAKARSQVIPGVGAVLWPCETGHGRCHEAGCCCHRTDCCGHRRHPGGPPAGI